jgi:hypothetical protein
LARLEGTVGRRGVRAGRLTERQPIQSECHTKHIKINRARPEPPHSPLTGAVRFSIASAGMKVAPICCVMPPASPSCVVVNACVWRACVLVGGVCVNGWRRVVYACSWRV